MQTAFFQYLYVGLLALCAVSVVLWMGVVGMAPLGLRVAYTEGGTMLISRMVTTPVEGREGVFRLEKDSTTEAHVTRARIDGVMRTDGVLMYYTNEQDGVTRVEYPAKTFQGSVYVSVPGMGYLVAALTHPVGFMACIGTPIVMLLVHVLQAVFVRVWSRQVSGVGGASVEQCSV